MFYIKIQDLDYDDYPLGSPTKIGPFDSKKDADSFMDESTKFRREFYFGDFYEYRVIGRRQRHSVHVYDITADLQSPAYWS